MSCDDSANLTLVDEDDVVLFNFHDSTGLANPFGLKTVLANGLNLGAAETEFGFFNPESRDGGLLVRSRQPLVLSTWGQYVTSDTYDNLTAGVGEMLRLLSRGGILKWAPDGASEARYLDFIASPAAALFRGQDLGVKKIIDLLTDYDGVPISVYRQPYLRGPELSSATNQLRNSTLLSDRDADGRPNLWAWDATTNIATESIDALTESYKFDVNSVSERLFRQIVPALVGEVWTFQFEGLVSSPGQLAARIEFLDGSGTVLATANSALSSPSTFTRITVTSLAAPASTAAIRVSIRCLNSGAGTATYRVRKAEAEEGSLATRFIAGTEVVTNDPIGLAPTSAPSTALVDTVAANAVGLEDGNRKYVYTYVSAAGETTASVESGGANTTAGNRQNDLSAITVGPTGTIARRIYRTSTGVTLPYRLVAEISDNTTTTYTDVTPDTGLGAALPVQVAILPLPPTTNLVDAPVAQAVGIEDGTRYYVYTFVNADGESNQSPVSNGATTTAGNRQNDLSSIDVGPAGTTARRIYRGASSSGASPMYFITEIADNVTTVYSDVTSDAAVGAAFVNSPENQYEVSFGRVLPVYVQGEIETPIELTFEVLAGASLAEVFVARRSNDGVVGIHRLSDYLNTRKSLQAEAGTLTNDSAIVGTTVETTYATTEIMAKRIRLSTTTLLDSLKGAFEVWVRVRLESVATQALQLRWATSAADPVTYSNDEVVIGNTAGSSLYIEVNLGQIFVPDEPLAALTLELWSRDDTAATPDLFWDALFFVPVESVGNILTNDGPPNDFWLGSQLVTPTSPAGLTAGTVSNYQLLLNDAAGTDAGGNPPVTGVVYGAGPQRAEADLTATTGSSGTMTIRNVTDSTVVATLNIVGGSGRQVYRLDWVAVAGKSYQIQIRMTAATGFFVVYSISRSQLATVSRFKSSSDNGASSRDASDNFLSALAVEGQTPMLMPPGLSMLYLFFGDISDATYAGSPPFSVAERAAEVSVRYSPRYYV